ncbi:MAG: DUF1559 domain-containing protein [Thermoguttaceae bacterium]
MPAISPAREAARRAQCISNLKIIGLALHNYHDAYKHFPSPNTCDKDGKPLYSWRVEVLPMLEYGGIYDSLNKDEPWNSPHNAKILNHILPNLDCPNDNKKNISSTSYVAIIGPGTAWRENGPVKLSDLPSGSSHTIMCVEVADSGVHWAEPRDLTVDEALEGLKTGKGLRISTAHPSVVNVLCADCAVHCLPAKMPISLWKIILAGEIKDFDNIENMIDPSAPDMVDVSVYATPYEPGKWLIILSAIIWLLSVVLLFRRAIKSRRKPEAAMQNPQMTQINADKT